MEDQLSIVFKTNCYGSTWLYDYVLSGRCETSNRDPILTTILYYGQSSTVYFWKTRAVGLV